MIHNRTIRITMVQKLVLVRRIIGIGKFIRITLNSQVHNFKQTQITSKLLNVPSVLKVKRRYLGARNNFGKFGNLKPIESIS